MEELGGKDIQDIVKEMEDTDFRSSLESKLPAYNTRVKLPTVNERMTGFEGNNNLFRCFPIHCINEVYEGFRLP